MVISNIANFCCLQQCKFVILLEGNQESLKCPTLWVNNLPPTPEILIQWYNSREEKSSIGFSYCIYIATLSINSENSEINNTSRQGMEGRELRKIYTSANYNHLMIMLKAIRQYGKIQTDYFAWIIGMQKYSVHGLKGNMEMRKVVDVLGQGDHSQSLQKIFLLTLYNNILRKNLGLLRTL